MTRRRTQGFTLIELMVVISIIGLLLILARPGLGGWRTASRQHDLTTKIANMGRRAASRARETGDAHRLMLRTASSRFTITIHQGMGRRCRQTAWQESTVADLPMLVDTMTYAMASRMGEDELLQVTIKAGVNEFSQAAICYEPGGKTYLAFKVFTAPSEDYRRQSTPIEARIARTGGSVQRTRIVIFPPAGTPSLALSEVVP